MPQSEAGMRIEPPPSSPIATGQRPMILLTYNAKIIFTHCKSQLYFVRNFVVRLRFIIHAVS